MMRKPDFDNNLLRVLKKEKPLKPTLFEFLISAEAEQALSSYVVKNDSREELLRRRIDAFYNAGYDYVPLLASEFGFTRGSRQKAKSLSLNEGGIIVDTKSFDEYKWNEPTDFAYDLMDKVKNDMPDGMKFCVYANDGILENVIGITGYDNLCFMLEDDRELVQQIFRHVGSRLVKYYELSMSHPLVGMVFYNDDWGFNTSTLISHKDLREFVYPYVKQITKITHDKNLPCAMHSCGNFEGIYDELYSVIGIDAKHSNEDSILPIEEAYKRYHGKIALLGGIDIDFMARSTQQDVTKRCLKMLETADEFGGYALGSGNSIASYIPLKNYFALLKCVNPDLKLN